MNKKKLCTSFGCNYPEGECAGLCWHPEEARMDIIGQNGNDGEHYHELLIAKLAEKEATRRPQSRFAAGAIPLAQVDEAITDMVNEPPHYRQHPSGVECIQITEHMGFCLGNAMKYIWRADHKHDALEDLRKAVWYIEREIKKRETLK